VDLEVAGAAHDDDRTTPKWVAAARAEADIHEG